jgi:hypothetical protein
MELFRRNSSEVHLKKKKDNMNHGYVGRTVDPIQEQLTAITSLINEISGDNKPVINSTHYIDNAILCSENIGFDSVSEEDLKVLTN